MSDNGKEDSLRIGFLTAVELEDCGYVGGLLVTNRFGRPLEFQCTSLVKPNRTQQLLYGPTLVPFLLGELIGRTLVEKSSVKPHLVFVDRREILEMRNHISIPVAYLDDDSQESGEKPSVPEADLKIGRQVLRLHNAHRDDRSVVHSRTQSIPSDANLREPFGRVREALGETLRSGASH